MIFGTRQQIWDEKDEERHQKKATKRHKRLKTFKRMDLVLRLLCFLWLTFCLADVGDGLFGLCEVPLCGPEVVLRHP